MIHKLINSALSFFKADTLRTVDCNWVLQSLILAALNSTALAMLVNMMELCCS